MEAFLSPPWAEGPPEDWEGEGWGPRVEDVGSGDWSSGCFDPEPALEEAREAGGAVNRERGTGVARKSEGGAELHKKSSTLGEFWKLIQEAMERRGGSGEWWVQKSTGRAGFLFLSNCKLVPLGEREEGGEDIEGGFEAMNPLVLAPEEEFELNGHRGASCFTKGGRTGRRRPDASRRRGAERQLHTSRLSPGEEPAKRRW